MFSPGAAFVWDGHVWFALSSNKEYVRGEVHTNTVEGYFSLLKRGVIGTFHQVSRKHLPLYVAEFDHRYNLPQDDRPRAHSGRVEAGRGQAVDAQATQEWIEKMTR